MVIKLEKIHYERIKGLYVCTESQIPDRHLRDFVNDEIPIILKNGLRYYKLKKIKSFLDSRGVRYSLKQITAERTNTINDESYWYGRFRK